MTRALNTAKCKIVDLIGWFVYWDDSIGWRALFFWDWDTKHCTKLMWWWRWNGWFVCPCKGHDWYPDHCGRKDHDICYRCNTRRGDRP